jgi:hypothetical protein
VEILFTVVVKLVNVDVTVIVSVPDKVRISIVVSRKVNVVVVAVVVIGNEVTVMVLVSVGINVVSVVTVVKDWRVVVVVDKNTVVNVSVVRVVEVMVTRAEVTVTVVKLKTLTVNVVVVDRVYAHSTGNRLLLHSNRVWVAVYPSVPRVRAFCKAEHREVVRELGPVVTVIMLGPIHTCVGLIPPPG